VRLKIQNLGTDINSRTKKIRGSVIFHNKEIKDFIQFTVDSLHAKGKEGTMKN
jgi:hypothetical protein